jgi:SNF2 family DNA or RNA helicase
VHVYGLVAAGTVEERTAELQARKTELAASLFGPEQAGAKKLAIDGAQLEATFAPASTF